MQKSGCQVIIQREYHADGESECKGTGQWDTSGEKARDKEAYTPNEILGVQRVGEEEREEKLRGKHGKT